MIISQNAAMPRAHQEAEENELVQVKTCNRAEPQCVTH
jgi:glutamyl-tRNA reductase